MKDIAEQEVIDLDDMDVEAFNEFAAEQGWSDGMPLYIPTEDKVAKFVETVRGDNRPYPPVPPRQVVPTLQALAANAVMAGCKPEYFPVVTAALRGVLDPEYNLHGTLATTHSCAPMVMVSGPIRHELDINCGSNCFGQGWQANATIGRALGLMLLNVAGAKPGRDGPLDPGQSRQVHLLLRRERGGESLDALPRAARLRADRQRGDGDVGRRPAQSQRPRQHHRRSAC